MGERKGKGERKGSGREREKEIWDKSNRRRSERDFCERKRGIGHAQAMKREH